MVGVEGLELDNGINSQIAANEVIRFLGDSVGRLEETGFSNRWTSGERTEYHLSSSIAPGIDGGTPEWEKAYERSLGVLRVIYGRIYTDTETGMPIYASVGGEFAHVPLANPRVVRTAANSWHARIGIPTPKVGQTQRVIMDSWHMPMQSFWEHANNTVLKTDDEVAEYQKWYDTWHKNTPQGIPIRAQNVAHDVIGRDGALWNGPRERIQEYSKHIGSLVSNVCESLLVPEEV